MAQTPRAGMGDSVGRFCRYQCPTLINCDSNFSMCATFLRRLLPPPDICVLQPIPRRWDSKWSSECKTKLESSMVITGLFSKAQLKKDLWWPSRTSICISTSISNLMFSGTCCRTYCLPQKRLTIWIFVKLLRAFSHFAPQQQFFKKFVPIIDTILVCLHPLVPGTNDAPLLLLLLSLYYPATHDESSPRP